MLALGLGDVLDESIGSKSFWRLCVPQNFFYKWNTYALLQRIAALDIHSHGADHVWNTKKKTCMNKIFCPTFVHAQNRIQLQFWKEGMCDCKQNLCLKKPRMVSIQWILLNTDAKMLHTHTHTHSNKKRFPLIVFFVYYYWQFQHGRSILTPLKSTAHETETKGKMN